MPWHMVLQPVTHLLLAVCAQNTTLLFSTNALVCLGLKTHEKLKTDGSVTESLIKRSIWAVQLSFPGNSRDNRATAVKRKLQPYKGTLGEASSPLPNPALSPGRNRTKRKTQRDRRSPRSHIIHKRKHGSSLLSRSCIGSNFPGLRCRKTTCYMRRLECDLRPFSADPRQTQNPVFKAAGTGTRVGAGYGEGSAHLSKLWEFPGEPSRNRGLKSLISASLCLWLSL